MTLGPTEEATATAMDHAALTAPATTADSLGAILRDVLTAAAFTPEGTLSDLFVGGAFAVAALLLAGHANNVAEECGERPGMAATNGFAAFFAQVVDAFVCMALGIPPVISTLGAFLAVWSEVSSRRRKHRRRLREARRQARAR